jgi:hypothetical protein
MDQDSALRRASRAALAATVAGGMFAGAVHAAPPDHAPAHGARGETPPAHPPAHGVRDTQPAPEAQGEKQRPAPPQQAPAHGRRATKPSKAKRHEKSAPPRRAERAKPKQGESSGGGQTKVTICHSTGSATNPYVTITIAEPAVKAHARHHDGRDIIPAPASGCPTGEQRSVERAGGASGTVQSGDPAAPVLPAGAPVTPAGAPSGERRVETGGVLTSSEMGSGGSKGRIGVLGAIETEPGDRELVPLAAETAPAGDDDADRALPFTGLELALVALGGLVALLLGLALRRATQTRPTA